jgi:formyltetrahydrofolate deformylase
MAIGQDTEVRTLRQAVGLFAQQRVLLDGTRTVVFR